MHLWTLKEMTSNFIRSQMSKIVSHTYGAHLTPEVQVVRRDDMHCLGCLTNVTVAHPLMIL